MVAPDGVFDMIDADRPKITFSSPEIGESITVCLNELLICLLVTGGFGQVRRTYMQ